MRECHSNFAHGPMKLLTKTVVAQYHNRDIECPKTIYACEHCDFELHEKWMQEKLERDVAKIYFTQYEHEAQK